MWQTIIAAGLLSGAVSLPPSATHLADVYLVKAKSRNSRTVHSLTGCRILHQKGIITALHGVVGCDQIRVTNLKGRQLSDRSVHIRMVDVSHDLALLTSSALEALPDEGFSIAANAPGEQTYAKVFGYPLGLERDALVTPILVGGERVLSDVVSPDIRATLVRRASPDPGLRVYYLVGFFHPGHSGAPIVNASDELIGIGNGGLPQAGGGAGLGWAIPFRARDLRWQTVSQAAPRLTALQDDTFNFNRDVDDRLVEAKSKEIERLQAEQGTVRKDLEAELQRRSRQSEAAALDQPAEISSDLARSLASKISPDSDDYGQALKAIALRRFNEALGFLALAEARLTTGTDGKPNPKLGWIYRAQGDTNYLSGHYDAAVRAYERAQQIQDDRSIRTALGVALTAAGRYERAAKVWGQLLRDDEASRKPSDPLLTITLQNMAQVLQEQGKLSEVETLLLRARTIQEGAPHPNERLLARTLNDLGVLSLAKSELADAEPLLRRAVAIRMRLDDKGVEFATSLNNLALVRQSLGDLKEAEALLRRGRDLKAAYLGKAHPATATIQDNLGGVLLDEWKLDEAEPALREALAVKRATLGADHPSIASPLDNLAQVLRGKGDLQEASKLAEEALRIRRKAFPGDHTAVAASLNTLGSIEQDRRRLAEAEKCFVEALAMRKRILGEASPVTAMSLNNLGELYRIERRLEEAEPLLRNALSIKEKTQGESYPTAITLNNLGLLLEQQRKFDEAEGCLQRALVIKEKCLEGNHPSLATGLHNLAHVRVSQGKLSQAEPMYRRALQIRKQVLGDANPNTQVTADRLADVLRRLGLPQEPVPN